MFPGNKKYLFSLLVIIVLLPAALVALFEYSTLKKNEQVIERAYIEQLNAILFSVNQYTDDVLSSTIREINYSFREKDNTVESILANNNFILDFSFLEDIPESLSPAITNSSEIRLKAKHILSKNQKALKRLADFYEVGYYRLEPFPIEETGLVLFAFIVKDSSELKIAAITVDAVLFIKERLDPQIQKIAGDQFQIAVLNKNNRPVYHTGNSDAENAFALTSSLQAFSQYKLGISLKGQTIDKLVKERSRGNLIFISIVSLILLIAGWLVIRIFNKQIELANLKSDFVSSVSHEIRTPLSLINMYAETIEMGRASSEETQKSFIKTILQETNRLSVMVNKILSFSEIEKKKKQYSLTSNHLNKIVKECYESYIPFIEKQGFQHSIDLDNRVNSAICDAEAIKDILVNLIDNAIKYSFEEKSIKIKTFLKVNKVCFSVEDKGIGINDKNKKYLFDKFYRVANNDVSIKVKGSGLGLSIVKHIVDAHQGKIEIKSKIGEGSTFTILLPNKLDS